MNKIQILSAEQAIKIAAGEVVERPINIIKEIIENSIDAGATKISLFIQGAGKKLIKVIDNGCGMTPDDAKLSVAPHATSKITKVEDLETIATFGFRGEALASINAVSMLKISTKTEEAQTGTCISWAFGTLQAQELQSHPTGTTLEIANLFDNIPARQKFLKKDETEWRAIVTLFQAFCLDYTHIHFQLYNEDKLQLNCPAVSKLSDRVTQLFDNNLQEKILNIVDLTNKVCSITGIISNPTYYRYDRNQIFIFVNNRWVKNIDLTKAIMRGYAGLLPAQKFPAAMIFIQIDADQVDVNIHPKKEEVKFLHPKKIENLIAQSIKATLEEATTQHVENTHLYRANFTPQFSLPTQANQSFLHTQTSRSSTSMHEQKPAPFSFLESETIASVAPISTQSVIEKKQNIQEFDKPDYDAPISFPEENFAAFAFEKIENIKVEIESEQREQISLMPETHREFAIIGQYKQTYILFEKDNNLVFVDQHAAHERILYEQFKANFQNITTIQLMFPEFIKLQTADIVTITPYLTILKEHGIDAEVFSDTQLVVQATPVHLKNQALQETMQQIIGWITQTDETEPERICHILHEKIHTKMACSAAIKAGDTLNLQQMQQLLDTLAKIDNRFSCPHGRPTFWTLQIDYLEKQFKRDYGKKAEQFYDFL